MIYSRRPKSQSRQCRQFSITASFAPDREINSVAKCGEPSVAAPKSVGVIVPKYPSIGRIIFSAHLAGSRKCRRVASAANSNSVVAFFIGTPGADATRDCSRYGFQPARILNEELRDTFKMVAA